MYDLYEILFQGSCQSWRALRSRIRDALTGASARELDQICQRLSLAVSEHPEAVVKHATPD